MIFEALGSTYKVTFNVDAKKESDFSSITIEHKNISIEIESKELNIRSFSDLEEVQLLNIAGSDTYYIRIINFGEKHARIEDRLFFNAKNYIKRVTLRAGVELVDPVKYVTKINGENEVLGDKK